MTRSIVLLAACAVIASACTNQKTDAPTDSAQLTIEARSTRADMVTGGDVLVSVNAKKVTSVRIGAASRRVDFTVTGDGTSTGLVTGLPEGASTITVAAGGDTASLKVTNHRVSGPVFSGKQLPMTVCTTDQLGLEPATPPTCDAPARVNFGYIDARGKVQPLEPGALPSADAKTVTIGGTTQAAILRIERGVINRAVYDITTLANGTGEAGGAAPASGTAWDKGHWNGRLVYRFGGGCGTTYGQGFLLLGAPDPRLLADGYAFATSTLNTFQVQCQDIVSAETAMMVKEHFVESYGEPAVTIGEGGSGGAIQQLLIAQNYPGILDAIGPSLVFPDAFSIAPGIFDCALLRNYYASPGGADLTSDQQAAVNGHLTADTCALWQQTFVPVIDPTKCGFGDGVSLSGAVKSIPGLELGLRTVPADQTYDPITNRTGIRCTAQDSYRQVFAKDPATGFAERPYDNIGVQYGLKALNETKITPEQFINLNAKVGGFDIDGHPIPDRMAVTEKSIEPLYSTGRVVEGGPLLDVPIIALNVYTDDVSDIHDRFRMFSLNERLKTKRGKQAPNYVMWTRPRSPKGNLLAQLTGSLSVGADQTRLLDEWATALKADTSKDPMATKMARARPKAAVNTCFNQANEVEESGPAVYDKPGPCTDPYPLKDDPRTASGAPLRNDIAKCALQSVAAAAKAGMYKVDLTPEHITRLKSVFPDGVCDWSKPGIGHVKLGPPWQDFSESR